MQSKPNRRPLVLIVGIVLLAVVGGVYFYQRAAAAENPGFTLSGTIEATEILVSSRVGGQVQQVNVSEGDNVQASQDLIDIYSPTGGVNEKITAPIDGVVLERLIEPSETVAPGGTLLVLADLNTLTLKVYVPEDRYGQISLGQTYPVAVDSFPGQSFSGKVSHIANQAEFTPRNVQTIEGRKTTVFAITLDLVPSDGKLKPGMPADVTFDIR